MPRKRGQPDQPPRTVDEWLKVFPPLVRDGVRAVYAALSPEQQRLLEPMLEEFGRYLTADDLLSILGAVKEQFPERHELQFTICIVGPVNTGKSSLYNALVGKEETRAEVSPLPGTTKQAQAGTSGVLTVVDTPGADDVEIGQEGEHQGQRRRQAALEAAQRADFLIIVLDASTGISQGALRVYQDLSQLGKPYVIVLNKIDLVEKHAEQVVESAARNLQVDPSAVLPTSALKGTGLDALVFAVVRAKPELLFAVAEVMPRYRFALAQRRTMRAVAAAGTVNLATSPIPVPFASFVPLTGIQAGLVLSIARIYGYRITPGRARELLTTFAAGLGARTLFQQLVTKIPGAGWALGTAIAAGTTLAIGYSAIAWFGRGEQISAETARANVEAFTREIVNALRGLDRSSLSREGLADMLDQVTDRVFRNLRDEPGDER